MDTLPYLILSVFAAVITIMGLLVLIARKTVLPLIRRLQALLRSIWRKLSKPIYMWLGWLVTESDMNSFIGGRWGINTPVHPIVKGEKITTFADISAKATRWPIDGKATGWVIDLRISGGLSSCSFPIENRQNKRKYFRRLKESQRMLLCGIAVPDLPPPNIRVVHCDLMGVWERWDQALWKRVAGRIDILPAPSRRWFRLGRWIGGRLHRPDNLPL